MSVTIVYQKPVGVTRFYRFDYASYDEVQQGETLSNPRVSATPVGLTLGTPVVSGTFVVVEISAGAAGTDYEITTLADFSGGATNVPCKGGLSVTA